MTLEGVTIYNMKWTEELENTLLELKSDKNNFSYEKIAALMGLTRSQVQNRLTFLNKRANPDFYLDIHLPCPKCGKERTFTNKAQKEKAKKRNSDCYACRGEILKVSLKGEKNPFFGKKHSKETIEKLSSERKGIPLSKERREESLTYLNRYLKDNPRKHPYQHWLVKFGREIADQKMEELREKNRIASSGERNPMFGKPTPKKAGNGWSGWYKNFYFRSIRELTFFLENENRVTPIHLDRDFSVKYIGLNGQQRTYSADFILDGKTIIEIKPKKLWETRENLLKFSAMIDFCEQNRLTFQVLDVKPNTEILKEKYLNGEIFFDKKCDEKFRKFCRIAAL